MGHPVSHTAFKPRIGFFWWSRRGCGLTRRILSVHLCQQKQSPGAAAKRKRLRPTGEEEPLCCCQTLTTPLSPGDPKQAFNVEIHPTPSIPQHFPESGKMTEG